MSGRRAHPTFGYGPMTVCPYPTLTAAFYHQAAQVPSNVAVRDLSGLPRDVTYRELAERAQILAAHLRSLGVRPHQRVPLVVKRGLEMVIGIWAVLSCGAQYVPLDGGVVPDSTIRHVIEQSQCEIILCLSSTAYRVQDLCPDVTRVVIESNSIPTDASRRRKRHVDLATADGGCYVIYTSGTTGKPKGVDVTHKNVTNLVCLSPGDLAIRPGISVGSLLNISFDMAAWEIFACFCNGGTLVIRGANWEPALAEIDVLICTPTILSKYHPTQFPKIKVVATAGEATSQSLADLWATHTTYWNCCGPTETTIVNTMQAHVPGDGITIGKPTPNNTVYILDAQHRVVSVGEPGVMWAGGHGVSRGYVGLPDKTREVYIPDPFAADGSQMYKTGDLGRWRRDGCIEILGRVDDQVKVKGFRVELDGISVTLSSAPGVSRAVVLLVEGEIHGFVCPKKNDAQAILEHTQGRQPYYAVPSHLHLLDQFPTTANGKIDKKALWVLAAPQEIIIEKRDISTAKSDSDHGTIVEVRSVSSGSTVTVTGEHHDLTRDIPDKLTAQPLRGLRYRALIIYRLLFSLVGLFNIGALVAILVTNTSTQWLATLTAANLVTAVLIRQDMIINILYTIFCSTPKFMPLWVRSRCAKIYHLGGVHSGAGFCATAWLLASTVQATIAKVTGREKIQSLATLVLSWMLCVLCCVMLGSAWPAFRKKYHNIFERMHRFVGWTTLVLFWARTALSIRDSTPVGHDLGLALAKSPGFWLLGLATCSIASSWLFLRKVPVHAEPLSDHAIRLYFDYTVPVNGSFTRLSRRPLLEWHSFATIPSPEPVVHTGKPGYSLVVSNAGDWTKSCVRNPPTKLWVRGIPTCGVMRIATLFNRLVIIATGSGIGPLLGHISKPSCPTQLIWSAAEPESTFGKDMIDTVRQSIPGAIIHDTKILGRPDLVRMGYNLAKDFGAEAVIVIANEKITKKIVYGLETRGVSAYGAIWDS